MRYGEITTEQAIDLLLRDGVIYWTLEAYTGRQTVDWLMVSIFFNTQEIHSFTQGMKTKIYI